MTKMLEIRFRCTVEKVQTMVAGGTRVYLDLDSQQLEAAARLLAAAGETGLLFNAVLTEVDASTIYGSRRTRRNNLPSAAS